MDKQTFLSSYGDKLDLMSKNWDLPQRALIKLGSPECHVRVSLKGEINKDTLYYVTGSTVYELDVDFLRTQLLDENDYKNTGFFKFETGNLKAIGVPIKYLKQYDLLSLQAKQVIKQHNVEVKETVIPNKINRLLSNEEFDKELDELLSVIKDVLSNKRKEYNAGRSWDESFKRTAFRKQKKVLHVVDGYLDKHLESYYDLLEYFSKSSMPDDIKDIEKLESLVKEKTGDIINYMIIQRFLMLKQTRSNL